MYLPTHASLRIRDSQETKCPDCASPFPQESQSSPTLSVLAIILSIIGFLSVILLLFWIYKKERDYRDRGTDPERPVSVAPTVGSVYSAGTLFPPPAVLNGSQDPLNPVGNESFGIALHRRSVSISREMYGLNTEVERGRRESK